LRLRQAEPGDYADRLVTLSGLAGKHNTGPGQHITTPGAPLAAVEVHRQKRPAAAAFESVSPLVFLDWVAGRE